MKKFGVVIFCFMFVCLTVAQRGEWKSLQIRVHSAHLTFFSTGRNRCIYERRSENVTECINNRQMMIVSLQRGGSGCDATHTRETRCQWKKDANADEKPNGNKATVKTKQVDSR